MKHPRQKTLKQRQQLLAAARGLFAAQGFDKTTTRQITAAVGGADSLLYYYFPEGKHALLDAIVKEGAKARQQATVIDFSQVKTREALATTLLEAFDRFWYIFQDPALYETLIITIRERKRLTDAQTAWLSDQLANFLNSLTKGLATLPEAIALPAGEETAFATTIIALFQKFVLERLVMSTGETLQPSPRPALQPAIHLLVTLAGRPEACQKQQA